ncbi:acidic 82 kD protein mRNA-like protein, partial [Leptotrombidium deliense]
NGDSDSDEDINVNSLFVIDKNPNDVSISKEKKDVFKKCDFSSQLQPAIDTSGYFKCKSSLESIKLLNEMTVNENCKELENKSAMSNGIERSNFYMESRREMKKRKKLEKEKTKGSEWFNLPATEMTEERKRDLMLLQMRNVWDPKRFYKKNDSSELPKYFQVATVVDAAADFYSDRVVRKDRKNTLVDELLADAEFKKWSKKKYVEALKNNPYYLRKARKEKKRSERSKAEKAAESHKSDKGARKHAKKLKKRK